MSPKGDPRHGSRRGKDKDPTQRELVERIRNAPFGPDEPAKVQAGARGAIAKALARKFGGKGGGS